MGNLKRFETKKYVFRTYHHAGGARKAANTYRDDAEEARKYCTSFSTNRGRYKSKCDIVDIEERRY